jgi:exopolysaccharide biosynthesis protein
VLDAISDFNGTAPGSGFSRQKVHTDFGDFIVDIVAADLGSTRVIVDSASDSDCHDNCPVMSLGDYVGRSGAFAGVNGSYFCPADYPSCAGKTNSFDTLIMNKNKHYINSDNNVYSTVPAVIFQGGSVRFVGQSLEWGRDTGVDGVLANQPLLVSGGNVVFGGDDEVKRAGAGSRSFVGSTGSTVYIGVVHGASAAQMARVLKTMGVQNALNLDSGGSTALWSGGYRVGPGRAIPNAILFVRK